MASLYLLPKPSQLGVSAIFGLAVTVLAEHKETHAQQLSPLFAVTRASIPAGHGLQPERAPIRLPPGDVPRRDEAAFLNRLARPSRMRPRDLLSLERPMPAPLVDQRVIHELHVLHNNARIQHKKPLLELSEELNRVAQAYAELLQRNGRSAHNLDGVVANRLARAGYRYVHCAENLADTGPLVDHGKLFRRWMGSPKHFANVLGPYREMGIGHYGSMWVVVFATPQR